MKFPSRPARFQYTGCVRRGAILLLLIGGAVRGQDGQQGSRPGWPCVPGRPVDPAYIETSESTGGQLFLFQRNEVAQSGVVMSASYTHPATVLRAIGHLAGTRDFEFPVDSGVRSVLLMASLQCRNAIQLTRPDGAELTVANSAQSIELQAGRIVRVDNPEPGIWRVRLTGTGLFVLAVQAKAEIRLAGVTFAQQQLEAHLAGEVSNVRFRLVGAGGEPVADIGAVEAAPDGTYRMKVTPPVERFRLVVSGSDGMARPFQRTHPVLFRAGTVR